MQVVERLHHASRIETRGRIVEVSLVTQDRPQLAAQAALHQHVQIFAILKGFVQFDDKFAIRFAHDFLLAHDVLLLSCLDDLGFLHLLESKRT